MKKILVTLSSAACVLLLAGLFAVQREGLLRAAVAAPATQGPAVDQPNHSENEAGHDHEEHRPGNGHEHEEEPAHADEQDGHEDHAGHDGHDEHEDVVRLSPEQMREFGVEVAQARSGRLGRHLGLPGEVVFNPDRVAHVLPRTAGVVQDVHKSVGDAVRAGDVLAVLDSRELARAKAQYLATFAREDLARTNHQREEKLWQDKITPESEYLDARQALTEAQIQRRLAERELHALGLSEEQVLSLPDQPEESLTCYAMTAPIDGVITERHLVRGEVIAADAADPAFVIADLGNVWVHLTVYQKDLADVRPGQSVRVDFGHGIPQAAGTISYVSPSLQESTRTATARVVLENPDGRYRPGLFVTGQVQMGQDDVGVLVPRTAVTTYEDRPVVFVRTDEGFEPAPVKTGRSNGSHVEIVEGLQPGQPYVAEGAFTLKAELGKGSFGGHTH